MFVSFVVITSLLQAYLLWSLTTLDTVHEKGGFAHPGKHGEWEGALSGENT